MRAERCLPPAVVRATRAELVAERHPLADEDVHFTRRLARTVIEAATAPGDLVLDPFAGFGTTLAVATELGREAVGLELLPERVDAIRAAAPGATVVEGDARGLRHVLSDLADVALCLTSPPYMTANDHPANPLAAYETDDGDYHRYLSELTSIAEQLVPCLRTDGVVALNVADIGFAGHRTPLVADVTAAVASILPPFGVTEVVWDELPEDLVRDAVVWFAHPTAAGRVAR